MSGSIADECRIHDFLALCSILERVSSEMAVIGMTTFFLSVRRSPKLLYLEL